MRRKFGAVLDWELSTLGNPLADSRTSACACGFRPTVISPDLTGMDRAELGVPDESGDCRAVLRAAGNSVD